MNLEDQIRENQNPLLSMGDAARSLGITTETLRQWIKRGDLAYEEVGTRGSRRVRRSEVERLRRRVTPSSASVEQPRST